MVGKYRFLKIAGVFLWVWAPGFSRENPLDTLAIAVAYNVGNVESRASARLIQDYYKLPNSQMIPLASSSGRFIDRDEYQSQIEKPLLGKLEELETVKYLILTKGLPLQIADKNPKALQSPNLFYKQDGASLESELLDLFHPLNLKSGWRERFEKKGGSNARKIFVSRMDGKEVIDIQMRFDERSDTIHPPFRKFIFAVDSSLEKDPKLAPIIHSAKTAAKFLDSLQLSFKVIYTHFETLAGKPDAAREKGSIVWLLTNQCLGRWEDNWDMFTIYQFAHSGQIQNPHCFSQISHSSSQKGNWAGLLAPSPLSVFPLPHEFLALLLKGQFPLGDVWEQILYFSSWQINLSFDPLWNPFEKRQLLELDQMEKLLELGQIPLLLNE